jgi:hypothetical protein
MAEQIERRRLRGIVSGPVSTPNGPTSAFSALDGTVEIVNVAQTRNSSGEDLAPGEGTVLSVGPDDTFVDASYIKTGVLDANLLRTGQLQTIASWNNKNYGSTEDSIESQQGFTGGYVYLEDWYTVSENTVYVKFADWAGYEASNTVGTTAAGNFFEVGDYVRVSGAYFGQDGDLVSADGTNANVGLVDQDDGPVKYGSVIAVDTTGTGLFYSVTETGKTTLDAGKLARSQDYIPTISRVVRVSSITSTKLGPPNPSEIYEVVVTTLGEHGVAVGDYVELASCGQVFSGVWYVVATPDENTFIYRNRFGIDADASLNVADLPELSAPTAIRVRKAYAVSSNGDLTAASINIRTARTQNGGNPIFQVLNDSVIIRKPDGTVLLSATTIGSSIDVGAVSADEITVGGDIDPNQIVRVGTNVSPAFQGIWAGNANPNSAEFSVDLDGNLVASNANISGTIQAAAGSIGGWTIGATQLYSSSIYLANGGRLQIGNSAEITGGAGGETIGNSVFYIDDEEGMWLGNEDFEQAPFRVTLDGTIVADKASITDLSVESLRMDGRVKFGTANGQLESFQVLNSELTGVAAQWNQDGIQISDRDITNSDRIYINGSQIQLIAADGTTLNSITADGINASAITYGALPGGSNLIPNSSFEFAPFQLAVNSYAQDPAIESVNIISSGTTSAGFTLTVDPYGY